MYFNFWIKCAFLIMQFLNKSKYLTLLEANRIIIFHDTPNYPFAFTKSNVIVTCTTIINLFIMLCLLFFSSVKHSLNHSGKTHFLFKSQRRASRENDPFSLRSGACLLPEHILKEKSSAGFIGHALSSVWRYFTRTNKDEPFTI